MAFVAAQNAVLTGLAAAYSAATSGAGGDTFQADPRHVLHVKNGSGSSINVTIETPGTVVGQAIGDVVVAVPATTERFIGPFESQHFTDPATGVAKVTWSAVTTVTFAVIRVAL